MEPNETQRVVQVVDFNYIEAQKAGIRWPGKYKGWLVRLDLYVVGLVYELDGRWLWEGPGEGCSLDQTEDGLSYPTKMTAVWGLLAQHEEDQI